MEKLLGNGEYDNQAMVREMIGEVLAEASKICDIRAEYVILEGARFDTESKSLIINDIELNIGKIIFGQVRKSESVAAFLCTAGSEIGELSRKKIAEKDFLKGYIFDIAGSEIVEAAANLMQQNLGVQLSRDGLNFTNRFSPGYCGWNVSEQHKLFKLVPDNFCGITLTESSLMVPIKSVSGIIGIGRDVKYKPYTCTFCDMKDCIYRKHREP